MKLADLNAQLLDSHHGDKGVGVMFDCPCGQCGKPCYVPFENPIKGWPDADDVKYGHPRWRREGETVETLTLTPSIWRKTENGGCGWHGHITNGEAEPV